jgi:hypothetical protein
MEQGRNSRHCSGAMRGALKRCACHCCLALWHGIAFGKKLVRLVKNCSSTPRSLITVPSQDGMHNAWTGGRGSCVGPRESWFMRRGYYLRSVAVASAGIPLDARTQQRLAPRQSWPGRPHVRRCIASSESSGVTRGSGCDVQPASNMRSSNHATAGSEYAGGVPFFANRHRLRPLIFP